MHGQVGRCVIQPVQRGQILRLFNSVCRQIGGRRANPPLLEGKETGDQIFVIQSMFSAAQGDVHRIALQIQQRIAEYKQRPDGGMFRLQTPQAVMQCGMGGDAGGQGDFDFAADSVFTFSSMANASSAQASRRVQEAASARPASVGAILRVLRLSSFTPY